MSREPLLNIVWRDRPALIGPVTGKAHTAVGSEVLEERVIQVEGSVGREGAQLAEGVWRRDEVIGSVGPGRPTGERQRRRHCRERRCARYEKRRCSMTSPLLLVAETPGRIGSPIFGEHGGVPVTVRVVDLTWAGDYLPAKSSWWDPDKSWLCRRNA